MRVTRPISLLALSLGLASSAAAKPPAPSAALFAALDAVGPIDGHTFDPRPVIAAVNLLVPLGKAEGTAQLAAYLEARQAVLSGGERDGLFAVLRVVFEPPPAAGAADSDACSPRQTAVASGGCLRAPRLGAPYPPPPEDLRSLRYPFFLLGDVPLSLVQGYALGGQAEPLSMHLRDLAAVATWRKAPLKPLSAGELRYLFVHYGQWSFASEVGQLVEAQLKRLDAASPSATPLVALRLRLRVPTAAALPGVAAVVRARLDALVSSGRYRLQDVRVGAAGKEVVVEAGLLAGSVCSDVAVSLVAKALAEQLTRPGTLGFFRVVEGPDSGLHEAFSGLTGGASATFEPGVAHVTGLSPAELTKRIAGLSAPKGVQFVPESPPSFRGQRASVAVWALDRAPALTSADVAAATVETSADADTTQVRIRFSASGRDRFAALSTAIVGRHLAIRFDGRLMSVPVVREPITGGEAVIALGGGSSDALLDEAREIVAALTAGPLTVALEATEVVGTCPTPAP